MNNWKKSYSTNDSKKFHILLIIGIFIGILSILLSLCFGNMTIPPADLINLLSGKDMTGMTQNIFWYVRLPRTLGCIFAGAALSVAGAILQNVLANKLASPSIIGVNAGAGLGVTICCAFGILSGWTISAAAFTGSLIVVLLIAIFSRHSNVSRTTVILGGVALNSILNAFSESITVLVPNVTALTTEFRVGGFSAISYPRLIPAMILIYAALLILCTLCNELDVIILGDDTAQSLGLPVKKYRILFLTLSALLAGAAVSFAGLLGFVGLIVPHFIRSLIGNESRQFLPLCIFYGGSFVTICDLISRLLFNPYELPVGILMSVIGEPLFVFLLLRYRGGHLNA